MTGQTRDKKCMGAGNEEKNINNIKKLCSDIISESSINKISILLDKMRDNIKKFEKYKNEKNVLDQIIEIAPKGVKYIDKFIESIVIQEVTRNHTNDSTNQCLKIETKYFDMSFLTNINHDERYSSGPCDYTLTIGDDEITDSGNYNSRYRLDKTALTIDNQDIVPLIDGLVSKKHLIAISNIIIDILLIIESYFIIYTTSS